MPRRTHRHADVKPLLATPATVAHLLACSYDAALLLINSDVFTAKRPHGRGRGMRVRVMYDEVEVYALAPSGSEELAVRDYRIKHGRLAPAGAPR
jgi:hypothetical protein